MLFFFPALLFMVMQSVLTTLSEKGLWSCLFIKFTAESVHLTVHNLFKQPQKVTHLSCCNVILI